MRAKPGQLLAYGYRDRRTGKTEVRFEGGDGVDPEVLAWFRAVLTEPHNTVLCMRGQEPLPAFIEELRARGYDLATFRFSMFLPAANTPRPTRLMGLRMREATLHARWGRDPDDGSPDICGAWRVPCRKGDVNLFFNLLSLPRYTSREVLFRKTHARTFRQELETTGFDLRTLRFEVKKPLS